MRVIGRHIIDEKLNFVLEFFHRKNCMQKFLQFFSLQILCAKIREKFTEVPLDLELKNAKNEICIRGRSHNTSRDF